jgi:hypothetical protein
LREGIDETTREIDLLRKQLRDTFDTDVNQSRFELIQNTTTCLLDRLSQMLGEYTDALLLHKDLLFIFFDRPIEVVVGKVVDKKQVTTNWLACCFFLASNYASPNFNQFYGNKFLDHRKFSN